MIPPNNETADPAPERTILHFDYDCFYASCFAARNPELKALPLGVKQKSILATCNYAARSRGVKKLMLIAEAKRVCPDLVIMNGEDLSPFRDMSKRLYNFIRSYSWNGRVERLGLDEVFLDISDIVDYNLSLVNPTCSAQSFFHLSDHDPEKGFPFDASATSGCVYPSDPRLPPGDDGLGPSPVLARLTIASHLASYLRAKIERDFHLTASCGISTNKLLSKLAGSRNKPDKQTTLLAHDRDTVLDFMDGHSLRKVPGIGFKIMKQLENYIHSRQQRSDIFEEESALTVRHVRLHPGMSSELLTGILGGPGSEKGLGKKVWGLLNGVDPTEVKQASEIPTQISIEDTYKGINTLPEVLDQLHALSDSLLKRMHIDLIEDDMESDGLHERRWVAHPKILRLSTNCRRTPLLPPSRTGSSGGRKPEGSTEEDNATKMPQHYSAGRTSRSQPLPSFVFSFKETREYIVERLVSEVLLPMFRHLHPAKQGWNLSLLNVCVANIVLSGNSQGKGNGRDISVMFRRQDELLREWTTYDGSSLSGPALGAGELTVGSVDVEMEWEEDDDDGGAAECSECGHGVPHFAMDAHQRYHQLGD